MAGNTFTQAFVIHKVLQNQSIKKYVLFLLDEDEQETVTKIHQYGIKNYMSKYYNQDNDIPIINDVFHRIISTFPQQYHSIISYDKRSYYGQQNTNHFRYYKLFFKQSDLIYYTFQYLDTFNLQSLVNCSLVDSIWLLHAFDQKCFEKIHYDVGQLLSKETKYYHHKHIWQRLRGMKNLTGYLSSSTKDHFNDLQLNIQTFMDNCKLLKWEQLQYVQILSETYPS